MIIDYSKVYELESKVCTGCHNKRECTIRDNCKFWVSGLESILIEEEISDLLKKKV